MKISAILCTHNPHRPFLARTLAGLRAQTLPAGEWELILVDNGSEPSVPAIADLGWHPAARIVREDEIGLTAARLRGIEEASGGVLVFVDDDNVLVPDYLERANRLAQRFPELGVWGCGSFQPEWEQQPPPEFAPYLSFLAVHQVPADRRSARPYDYAAMPAGAGMCVRVEIARRYAAAVRQDSRRKLLGRTGAQLNGCEDFDLAMMAIDCGRETGVFRELRLVHLMPRSRIEEAYLLRLIEGHAYSTVLLMALRGDKPAPLPRGLLARLREFRLRRSLDLVELRIHDARRQGESRAWKALEILAVKRPPLPAREVTS